MKKYILISLGIVFVGIVISSVFLFVFLKKNTDSFSFKKEKFIENSSQIRSENVKNDTLDDILQQNESIPQTKEKLAKNEEIELELPVFIENDAPFISQAPFGVWDDLHDEACEEAVLIIANGFLNNADEISKEVAEKEIQALVAWQMKKYGEHKDLNIAEIKDMALNFYRDELIVSENINEENFKKILANGDIIIIPAAGRELNNPFFTSPGPLYHALVVIGYDDLKREFITHDPGTKRGKEFRYSYDILLNSVHDFPGKKEKILEGKPRALIVRK